VALSTSDRVDEQPIYALQALGEALRQWPEHEAAGQVVLEMAARHTPNDFWIHCVLSELNLLPQKPNSAEALRHASMAVALRPHVPSAHVLLGRAFRGTGRGVEALEEVREAIRLDPNHATAHNELGRTLFELADYSGAAASYRQAYQIYPQFAEAHNNLGVALIYLDNVPEAISAFRRATDLRPNYATAWNHLGMALRSTGDLSGGLAAHRQALHSDPSRYVSHLHLGNVLVDLGQLREGEAALRAANKLNPEDAEVHVGIGLALREQGRNLEVRAAFERALQLDPKLLRVHSEYGRLLQRMGWLEHAAGQFQLALAGTPDDPQTHCDLARVFKQQGKFAASLASFRRGQEIGSQVAGWDQPSALWIQECEQLIAIECRLPIEMRESDYPLAAIDCLAMADVCRLLKRGDDAYQLYRRAFELAPSLANDLVGEHRFHAACAALMIRSAPGGTIAADGDFSRRRAQARRWLREELVSRLKAARTAKRVELGSLLVGLSVWLTHPSLEGVRTPGERRDVALDEREAWELFWEEVRRGIDELQISLLDDC